VPIRERDVDDADIVRSADDRVWRRWEALLAKANDLGVKKIPRTALPIPRSILIQRGLELDKQVREREQLLADQDAARAAGSRASEAPPVEASAGAEVAPPASF